MNSYNTIYNNLVSSRQHLKEEWEPIGSGLERHRIIPGHQGGTYDESNCTYLTHREHVIAHWLLWKIHGHRGDLSSWNLMKNGSYVGYSGELNPFYGKTHSEKTKEKLKIANLGKRQSIEIRNKKSATQSYQKKSKEFGDKIRKIRKHTNNKLKKVNAFGTEYRSIRSAAKATGYSHTNVRSFCLDSRNKDFNFII